jgi:hypothetical protein
MTYSNASPLMVHGKNQQVLRWLRLSVLGAEAVAAGIQEAMLQVEQVVAAGVQ